MRKHSLKRPRKPKSFLVALVGICMALLAFDFFLFYIPFSGWALQSVIIGVLLEYLGRKRTLALLAVIELMFIYSYGGLMALAVIIGLAGSSLFVPVIISSYLVLIAAFFFLGHLTNYLLHRIHLFESLEPKAAK